MLGSIFSPSPLLGSDSESPLQVIHLSNILINIFVIMIPSIRSASSYRNAHFDVDFNLLICRICRPPSWHAFPALAKETVAFRLLKQLQGCYFVQTCNSILAVCISHELASNFSLQFHANCLLHLFGLSCNFIVEIFSLAKAKLQH